MKALGVSVDEFDQVIARLETYRCAGVENAGSASLIQLLDEAIGLAGIARTKALRLDDYPTCSIRIGEGAAYFGEIAAVADETYRIRLSLIDELERDYARFYFASTRVTGGTLLSHEGYKGGHLIAKHVARTMEDFKRRFVEEGKPILSAFISREIAEETVWRAIEIHRSRIDLAREGEMVRIPIAELKDIGYIKKPGEPPQFTKVGTLLIAKDSDHPAGYRIVTAVLGKGKN
jgi:hypothetical protein